MLATAAAARYQQVRVTTSTPGELLLALYDGLFRFLNSARIFLERGERGRAGEQLSKAHAVLSELYLALDYSIDPDLCGNLAALYEYCMHLVTTANLRGDAVAIANALRVLTPLREAWQEAVPAAARERR